MGGRLAVVLLDLFVIALTVLLTIGSLLYVFGLRRLP